MLMIRFQRIGRTNDPAFRIVLIEKERAAKAGHINELLGTYNPRSKALTLNEESVKSWIAKGAQPTDSIKNLLINKGVIAGKKVNALPKKTPQKNEAKIAEEAVAAKAVADAAEAAKKEVETATAPAEEVPVAPTEAEVVAEALPAEETPVEATPVEAPATEATPEARAEEKVEVAPAA